MTQAVILIIEDNIPLGNMIKRRLEHLRYQVALARNGVTGKKYLETSLPIIILLDIHLPDKNGWEIASEIKSDQNTAHIPIIAVTAHAMAGDREKAIRAGCDDYITKPIDFQLLHEKIQNLI